MLHVGALAPLAEILTAVRNLALATVKYDLYVNLVIERVDESAATALIRKQHPNALILVSENRGMDIGGFFALLPHVLKGSYEYILKLHTKSSAQWRRSLLAPLCGSPAQVRFVLRMLELTPKAGMVGARSHLYTEPRLRKPNYYYIQQLATRFLLPYTDFQFIGGTMFWVRTSLIAKVFGNTDLHKLIATMNTPSTFDGWWYLINYRDTGVTTIEQAARHYQQHGAKSGRYANCLDARDKGARRYVPDGMIEHAYERLFGLIVKAQGLTILAL